MRCSVHSLLATCLLVATLVATAQAQTRAGFDTSGHVVMHGTPRFVLGVYDSGLSYSTDPAYWEQTLFATGGARELGGIPLNMYLNYWLGGMPITATNPLLDTLQSHGLMYLATGNCFASGSWLRYGATGFSIASQTYVQQFAQHPAAAGYYIMDECDDSLIPETQQHYQQLKSWDPQGLVLATTLAAAYRDPSLWVNAADLLAIDPYPMYGPEPSQGYPHFTVADFTARVRAAALPGRPVWSVLQFFKFTSDSRLPTPAEMRAHAVMSIVEGAQGLWWWDIGTNGLRALDAATVSTWMGYLKTLTGELAGLEPALLAASADGALVGNSTRFSDPVAGRIAQLQHNIAVEILYSRIQADQAEIAALQAGDTSKSPLLPGAANVRTRTTLVNGVGYVFAYNYTNLQQPVTFTWQGPLGGVKESSSGQSYTVSGASWSDTFGPYEARIYVVTPGTFQPLAVSFTNPASGATVGGTSTVTMAATGGSGYTYRLAVDGGTVYTGTNPSVGWNTTTVPDGQHTLTANVSDASSNTGAASVTVMVSNPSSPPPPPPVTFTASFSYPASGATVSGAPSVGMATTADWATTKTFTLSVDGTVLTSQTLAPGTTLWYTWDTTKVPNGAHTLQLAVTMSGQTATAALPVTVSNAVAPPPPAGFTASFTYPGMGATVSGAQSVGMATTATWGQSKTFTLSVDGAVLTRQTLTGTTLWYTWDTSKVKNGAHTLTLTVTMNGQTATSTLSVKVKH